LLEPNDIWHINAPKYPTMQYVTDLICNKPAKLALTQIMPRLDTGNKLVYYDSCRANLYAAIRRQCTAIPGPDDCFMDQVEQYFIDTILPEISELLADFHYSYEVWYNHLDARQQSEIDKLDLSTVDVRNANIFCKCEKQEIVNGDLPKNRAISAMCVQHKYVMGPIIYALEQYFKKFKGYCGGKTWEDMGQLYDFWYEQGFTRFVQSDLSGMDRSVKRRLLKLIEYIYDLITPHVTHVSKQSWTRHAFVQRTTIHAKYFEDKLMHNMGYCDVQDKVFSGESSTTWKNTTINVILLRFICEKLLQLPINGYGLAGKGDDSAAALPMSISPDIIRAAYYQCYYQAKLIKHPYASYYLKHGSGMVLKYLSISDTITDGDFCSTNTFYCTACKHHRLTRKLDRFINLTPWTDTAHNLTSTQRLAYMHNLHLANLKWCDGLPIFSQLNEKLRTNVISNYTLNGPERKTLNVSKPDIEWFEHMFNKKQVETTIKYQRLFGKNIAYSMIQQQSGIQKCCATSYYNWLSDKLDLDSDAVDIISNQIVSATGDLYQSALLTIGLDNLERHFIRTYDDTTDCCSSP
jgi:hypothetical protein